jgi:hypothetical protein
MLSESDEGAVAAAADLSRVSQAEGPANVGSGGPEDLSSHSEEAVN